MGEGEVEGVAIVPHTSTQTVVTVVLCCDANGIGNGIDRAASGTEPFEMDG